MSTDNSNNQKQVIYVDKNTADSIALGQMVEAVLSFSIVNTFIFFAILYGTIEFTNNALSKGVGDWVYVVVPGSILLCLFLAFAGFYFALTIEEFPTKLFYAGLATYVLNMHWPIMVDDSLQDEAVYFFVGVLVFMRLLEWILDKVPDKIPLKECLLGGLFGFVGGPYLWDAIVGFLKAAGWM